MPRVYLSPEQTKDLLQKSQERFLIRLREEERKKRQDTQSAEFMLQLTRQLVDEDIDRIVEERLKERMEREKRIPTTQETTAVKNETCAE